MNTDFDEVTWVAEHLPEADGPDGIATDRARLALLEHTSQARPQRHRRGRLAPRVMAGAAAVAAVAVVGGVIVAGHGAPPRPPAGPSAAPQVALAPQPRRVSGHPVLLRLASDITQAPAPPGNATLVLRTQIYPNQPSYSGYDLYEDNGTYYFGQTLDELRQALDEPGDGDRELGGILAAAAKSASLTPDQAAGAIYQASPAPKVTAASIAQTRSILRQKLAALGHSRGNAAVARMLRRTLTAMPTPRASSAERPQPPSQATIDNYLWGNCMDALEGGGGQADIRAGAMLALSTLPDVHVRPTTFDGQSVVQIVNTQFSDGYAETLDLDARTGVLVHMSGGTIGKADSVNVTYHVTRVTAPGLDPAH